MQSSADVPSERKRRIVLADEEAMLSDLVERILQPDFEIVTKVSDGRSLLAAAEQAPDVVVLDVSLPLVSGVDAVRGVLRVSPSTKVIVLTMVDDELLAKAVLDAGASAYVLKTASLDELPTSIREVLGGNTYITPSLAAKLRNVDPLPRPAPLTEREQQVLALLVDGKPMREVATILHLTPRTIAFHKYRIMKKLHVRSSAELIRAAIFRSLAR